MKKQTKRLLWIIFLGAISKHSIGQSTDSKIADLLTNRSAEFIGGDDRMFKILKDSLHYPKSALKDNISGRVMCSFTIDTLGIITDIHVIKGLQTDLDKEAIRLINLFKGWNPAMENGKKVKDTFVVPIWFELDE